MNGCMQGIARPERKGPDLGRIQPVYPMSHRRKPQAPRCIPESPGYCIARQESSPRPCMQVEFGRTVQFIKIDEAVIYNGIAEMNII